MYKWSKAQLNPHPHLHTCTRQSFKKPDWNWSRAFKRVEELRSPRSFYFSHYIRMRNLGCRGRKLVFTYIWVGTWTGWLWTGARWGGRTATVWTGRGRRRRPGRPGSSCSATYHFAISSLYSYGECVHSEKHTTEPNNDASCRRLFNTLYSSSN